MTTITKKTETKSKTPIRKKALKKASNIKIGILKGKIQVAEDAFEEDNLKTIR